MHRPRAALLCHTIAHPASACTRRQYGRSLALVASKAPHPEWAAFLCRCGLEALEVELGFHEVGGQLPTSLIIWWLLAAHLGCVLDSLLLLIMRPGQLPVQPAVMPWSAASAHLLCAARRSQMLEVQAASPPQEFLHHWGSDISKETAGAAPCPNSLLYTSWVTANAHERAFYEGGSFHADCGPLRLGLEPAPAAAPCKR